MMFSEQNPYTSCIRIGKDSIIPPLMTDERKSEMRYYRELAMNVSKRQKSRLRTMNNDVMMNGHSNLIEKKDAIPRNTIIPIISNEVSEKPDNLIGSLNKRRNSYTLECPSPAMIEYLLSHSDNHQVNATWNSNDGVFNDSREEQYSVTADNFEYQIENLPIEIVMCEENSTLEDLDLDSRRDSCSSMNSNVHNQEKASTPNQKNFPRFYEDMEANSFPNTNQPSPIRSAKKYPSNECLIFDKNLEPVGYKEMNSQNNHLKTTNGFMSNGIVEKNENPEYLNESFKSINGSNDIETGRGSVYSDCSSVSLSKFFSDKKSVENGDLREHSPAVQNMKEQLEQKHKAELMKLLEEQRKETEMFEQFLSSFSESTVSSPKSNYAYSKDVVLKKFSAENTPVPPVIQVSFCENSYSMSNKNMNVRRRIYDSDSKNRNVDEIVKIPVQHECDETANNKSSNLELRIRASTTINAAVRGYLVRRLFRTSRVERLLQTINECLMTAISLQSENYLSPEDLQLQHRVLQQSIAACNEIQTIFSLPVKDRMEIISTDREQKKRFTPKARTPLPLSEATKKTLQRRKSMNFTSDVRHEEVRKRSKSVSCCDRLTKDNSRRSTSRSSIRKNDCKKTTSISQKCSISQSTRPSRKTWL